MQATTATAWKICRINFPVESFIFRSFVCWQLDFLIIGVDFQQFQPLFLGLPMSLVGGFKFLKIGVEFQHFQPLFSDVSVNSKFKPESCQSGGVSLKVHTW